LENDPLSAKRTRARAGTLLTAWLRGC